jgi:hypothetical protein
MPQSKYDSYGGQSSGSSSDEEQYELVTNEEVTITAEVERVFGVDTDYGQNLGVVWTDVELTDGLIYFDAEKNKYKMFSWAGATGLSPLDAHERGMDFSADDADEVISRTYFGNQKTYELVAAAVEPIDGTDIDASSRYRRVESVEDGVPQFSGWTDNGGDAVPFPFNFVSWHSGTEDYGPSAGSTSLAERLTDRGEDIIVDEDDVDNWLADTSGNNILRDDLEGRRVEFFYVNKTSENGYNYRVAVLRDAETGAQIVPDNRDDDDTATGGSSSALTTSANGGTYPEPVADFISTADGIELDEERAGELLDDMIADTDTSLTEELVEEAGRDRVIGEVV